MANNGKRKNIKKRKNKQVLTTKRPLIVKDVEQEYAQVLQMYGGSRVRCRLQNDSTDKTGLIRNKLRRGKSNKMAVGDFVLVSIRSFDSLTVDIIHVYNADETRHLINTNQLIPVKSDDDDVLKNNQSTHQESIKFITEIEIDDI
jgi:initiation factor 1A